MGSECDENGVGSEAQVRAIMVMFDSLNRRFLEPYGCDWVPTPNFTRLAQRAVSFDNCYAGSMPCMPARRELHTGRHNFLHRSWGPLEPFDDSVPELLRGQGIYTHLVTDHQHYWEDGGATYHNRFNTFEFFRGQEGDAWKGHVPENGTDRMSTTWQSDIRRQDQINREYLRAEQEHPQTRVFDAGIEFLRTNQDRDRWFVQIECFDPHEPFFSYQHYRQQVASGALSTNIRGDAGPFDWPQYQPVTEPPEQVVSARDEYAALLAMCDASLGRVLDTMDELNLWEDTLLILATDHGFLLGEHDWWGKVVQPWYDENIHTPLMIWDPRSPQPGQRRQSLVQTVDIGPTILDFFGVDLTPRMTGRPLADTVAADTAVHHAALFGSFGGHVNVTDGRYVYMRAPVSPQNQPLYEHTVMPTHMSSMFTTDELADLELVPPFDFTQGVALLRMPGSAFGDVSAYEFGTLLFDLGDDPEQLRPLHDDEQELRMIKLMLQLMRANDAPPSQYQRLGLPESGPPNRSHLWASAAATSGG